MGELAVTIGLSTPDLEAANRWSDFIVEHTFASVTIVTPTWLDMIADPLFPPDIVILTVGDCSMRALTSQLRTCRHLDVLVILADPHHLTDTDRARQMDSLFIFHDESDADRTLDAVRTYREARKTGKPMKIPPRLARADARSA